MPPLTRSHSAEWEILHFLAAGPAKRRDLFRCYYMKERHPKASLSLPRWLMWFLFRDDGNRQSHRVCGSDHTTTDLFHNSCLQIGHCTVNYVGEKNALIWIKARRKKNWMSVFLASQRSCRITSDETGLILREEWDKAVWWSPHSSRNTFFPSFSYEWANTLKIVYLTMKICHQVTWK